MGLGNNLLFANCRRRYIFIIGKQMKRIIFSIVKNQHFTHWSTVAPFPLYLVSRRHTLQLS